MASASDKIVYILYVLPGEPRSERVIEIAKLSSLPIFVQDVRAIKRPEWLNGVPILANKNTREIWRGQQAMEQLKYFSQTAKITWPKTDIQNDLQIKSDLIAPVTMTHAPIIQQPPVVPQQAPIIQQPPVIQQPTIIQQPPVIQQLPIIQQPPVVQQPTIIQQPPVEPVITQPQQEPPSYPVIQTEKSIKEKKMLANQIQSLPPKEVPKDVSLVLPPPVQGFERKEEPTVAQAATSVTSTSTPPAAVPVPPITSQLVQQSSSALQQSQARRSTRVQTPAESKRAQTPADQQASTETVEKKSRRTSTKSLIARASSRVDTTKPQHVRITKEEQQEFDSLMDRDSEHTVNVRSETLHISDLGPSIDLSEMPVTAAEEAPPVA